jgi:hypothetical protein
MKFVGKRWIPKAILASQASIGSGSTNLPKTSTGKFRQGSKSIFPTCRPHRRHPGVHNEGADRPLGGVTPPHRHDRLPARVALPAPQPRLQIEHQGGTPATVRRAARKVLVGRSRNPCNSALRVISTSCPQAAHSTRTRGVEGEAFDRKFREDCSARSIILTAPKPASLPGVWFEALPIRQRVPA